MALSSGSAWVQVVSGEVYVELMGPAGGAGMDVAPNAHPRFVNANGGKDHIQANLLAYAQAFLLRHATSACSTLSQRSSPPSTSTPMRFPTPR